MRRTLYYKSGGITLMKFTRVMSMVLVGIMLALALVSCGSEPQKEVNVTVRIVAEEGADPILDAQVIAKAATPTVLDAFIKACDENEVPYVLESDTSGTPVSVQDVDTYTYHKDENGILHYWMYTINGEEPTSGKANTNTIEEGDVIVYSYVTYDPAESTAK